MGKISLIRPDSFSFTAIVTSTSLFSGCVDTDGDGDGGGETAVVRGPSSIPLDGDPNGLRLLPDGTLLIADDNNNRVLSFVDGDAAPDDRCVVRHAP